MAQYSKEDIARLVKDGRIAKGYTQQQLSDLSNISLRSIQRIENGEVAPRLYTLKILATQLSFSLADIAVVTPPVASQTAKFNRPRKVILSVTFFLLIVLLTAAFLSQSSRFPETDFERFLLWAAVLAVYGSALFRIWK
jgi:transcriptional regulator with XRE-family HTH domain